MSDEHRPLTADPRQGAGHAPADEKDAVLAFWDAASCGDVYAEGESLRERLDAQARARYGLEPYIFDFARFGSGTGKDVLEVGVGMGADHLEWARAYPRRLVGIDLTPRAVEYTRSRLELNEFLPEVQVGDAENLPFADESFDIVYSWGVLHHSPDTPRAIREVHRVLRPGGVARIMVYHKHSIVGSLLWLRYALLGGRPGITLAEIYSRYLESPGTKAYTAEDARRLFARFSRVSTHVELSCGDLMEGAAGQRHRGLLLSAARLLWPRPLVRRLLPTKGLFLLIEAVR